MFLIALEDSLDITAEHFRINLQSVEAITQPAFEICHISKPAKQMRAARTLDAKEIEVEDDRRPLPIFEELPGNFFS